MNGIFATLERVSYTIYLTQFLNMCLYLSCFFVLEYALVSLFLEYEANAQNKRQGLRRLGTRLKEGHAKEGLAREEAARRSQASQQDGTDNEKQDDVLRPGDDGGPFASNDDDGDVELRRRTVVEVRVQSDGGKSWDRRASSLMSVRSKSLIKKPAPPRLNNRTSWYHAIEGPAIDKPLTCGFLKTKEGGFTMEGSYEDPDVKNEFFHRDVNPALETDLENLKTLFDAGDRNGDKTIDPKEAALVMRSYGVFINDDTATMEIMNWFYMNDLRVPRERTVVKLTFYQFADFLIDYDHYTLGESNSRIFYMPLSLQTDMLCRIGYIPGCLAIFLVQYLVWFDDWDRRPARLAPLLVGLVAFFTAAVLTWSRCSKRRTRLLSGVAGYGRLSSVLSRDDE